jgi:hypothetical protein
MSAKARRANVGEVDAPRGWRIESHGARRYVVRKDYRLVPCDGACQNPMNDHCLSCAPLWGWKVVLDD